MDLQRSYLVNKGYRRSVLTLRLDCKGSTKRFYCQFIHFADLSCDKY